MRRGKKKNLSLFTVNIDRSVHDFPFGNLGGDLLWFILRHDVFQTLQIVVVVFDVDGFRFPRLAHIQIRSQMLFGCITFRQKRQDFMAKLRGLLRHRVRNYLCVVTSSADNYLLQNNSVRSRTFDVRKFRFGICAARSPRQL